MTMEEAIAAYGKTFVQALRRGDGCCLPEADEELNQASIGLVRQYHVHYGQAWLGLVNFQDSEHRDQPLWQWDPATGLCNFEASFVVPVFDEELLRLIRDRAAAPYTGTKDDSVRVEAIHQRIKELGGHHLFWS